MALVGTGKKVKMMKSKSFAIVLMLSGLMLSGPALGQSIVVTPGSSAAYVFCANKNCPVQSKLGVWLFKLQLDSASAVDPAKKKLAFKDGESGLTWTTFKDRWYIGFGEYKPASSGSAHGTFSGYVDLPLDNGSSISPPLVPAITHYCTMNGPDNDVVGATYPRTAPTRQCHDPGGTYSLVNTGVTKCGEIPFPGTWPSQGNCVANFVRLRKTSAEVTNSTCHTAYSAFGVAILLDGCLYQARVVDLYVREVRDPAP